MAQQLRDVAMSDPKADNQQNPQTRVADSRRRLVQAGLASAPILLALRATPVLAANCKNPSGFSVSGNLSRPNDFVACNFTGPSGWRGTALSSWPAAALQNASTTKKLSDVFGTNPNYSNSVNNTRLYDALANSDLFIRFIVAGYLNSLTNGAFPATTAQITSMWLTAPSAAGYTPNPAYGSTWDVNETLAYLRYLMVN